MIDTHQVHCIQSQASPQYAGILIRTPPKKCNGDLVW